MQIRERGERRRSAFSAATQGHSSFRTAESRHRHSLHRRRFERHFFLNSLSQPARSSATTHHHAVTTGQRA